MPEDDKAQPLLGEGAPEAPNDVPEETWRRMSLRDRYRLYFKHGSSVNSTLPVFTVFAVYTVFGLIWCAGLRYLALDMSSGIFSARNARRFIIYNILHGILGLGATVGPLGVKNKVPIGACFLTFLTPGTMSSPLLPGVVGIFQKIPARRGALGVAAFVVYFLALVRAMLDPSSRNVAIAVGTLVVASVFDTVVFFASRGEHYGYHLVCLMWPDWIVGCQWVQLMMYLWVGLAKCGPWFKYVIQVLMKDAIFTPCLPRHALARMFYKDWPHDFTPSALPRILHFLGAVLEWVFPLCCLFSPGTLTNVVGVLGIVAYHIFIWATLPMASVFEWQYYCIYMNIFLYGHNAFTLPSSPGLIVFLLIVSVVLPFVGQIWPQVVPFLMAYRQYAGNWRLGVWMIRKTAAHKVEKLRTYNSVLWQKEAPPELGGDRADYGLQATFLEVPQFRGMLSFYEKFLEDQACDSDNYWFISTFCVSNALFGWDLALGWTIMRECIRKALVDICELEPGDMHWVLIQPSSILPGHHVRYMCFDVTKGPENSDMWMDVAYKDLEGPQPTEVFLDLNKMRQGKCINGAFLGTYY